MLLDRTTMISLLSTVIAAEAFSGPSPPLPDEVKVVVPAAAVGAIVPVNVMLTLPPGARLSPKGARR